MAYGLEITGTNGQFIIDTTVTSHEFITVQEKGSSSSLTWNPGEKILFMKAASGTSIRGNSDATVFPNSKITFTSSTSYFFAEVTSNVSDFTAGDGYGLVVFDGTGTADSDVIFSTRKINKGLNVIKVFSPGELSNDYTTIYNDTAGTSDVYVSIGGFMYADPFGSVWGGFDYTANTITWRSLITVNFMGAGSFSLPNFGSVALARLVE